MVECREWRIRVFGVSKEKEVLAIEDGAKAWRIPIIRL